MSPATLVNIFLSAACLGLAISLYLTIRGFRVELANLLAYIDRLLDRVQAPEAMAASAPTRIRGPRPPVERQKMIRDRTGVIRVPIKTPGDVDEAVPTE